MSKKMTPQDWNEEFKAFVSAGELEPPKNMSSMILSTVHDDLNPLAYKVFSRLTLIHLLVGTATLLFCPQFGINILPGMGLMGLFMKFGDTICMMACGAVFLGFSALIASFILRPEEVKVIRKNKILQLSLLATISVGAFICFGEATILSLSLLWVLGSILGGLTTLEVGWQIRSYFRRRIIYGV